MLVIDSLNGIDDIEEFLNSSSDDFGVMGQLICQIRRGAGIIHHPDQPRFVIHTQNCFLELPINNHAVSHDDDVIKNDLVVRVME